MSNPEHPEPPAGVEDLREVSITPIGKYNAEDSIKLIEVATGDYRRSHQEGESLEHGDLSMNNMLLGHAESHFRTYYHDIYGVFNMAAAGYDDEHPGVGESAKTADLIGQSRANMSFYMGGMLAFELLALHLSENDMEINKLMPQVAKLERLPKGEYDREPEFFADINTKLMKDASEYWGEIANCWEPIIEEFSDDLDPSRVNRSAVVAGVTLANYLLEELYGPTVASMQRVHNEQLNTPEPHWLESTREVPPEWWGTMLGSEHRMN